MAKMADTKITNDNSGNQVRHSNPATHPLPPNAGQPMVAAVKVVGQANGAAQGQIPGTSVVYSNPA